MHNISVAGRRPSKSALWPRWSWSSIVVGIVFWGCTGSAVAETAWPQIALPKEASGFDIGGQVVVNGMPMRMRGFVSAARPEQLAGWFRQSLGKPLVEDKLAGKLVLGRLQDDFYLTVQLEPAGNGTRGLVAVTQLKAAYDNQADTQAGAERWLSRMPAGSRVISQMASKDGSRASRHIVIVNQTSEDLNRDRLTNLMREDGLTLEREVAVADQTVPRLPPGIVAGKTLFFKGPNKEAMAVIYRDDTGRTAIVLNDITETGRLK
jgi:hypothetical protein